MKYFIAKLLTMFPVIKQKPPKIGSGMLRGYGRVNYWYLDEDELDKDLARCKASGVDVYHIEYSGFGATNIYIDINTNKVRKAYKKLVKKIRALGMWLFVSVVNDNMGSGKYGDQKIPLSKLYNNALAELAFIKSCGSDNVIIQPVAETQTSAGTKFENDTKAMLAGWTLVNNGSGGRPSGNNGMTYRAVHPSSIANCSKYGNAIVSSDHGLIIKELAVGGTLNGPGSPQKITIFLQNSKSAGAPMCVYYAFQREKHDKDAIEAMGKI